MFNVIGNARIMNLKKVSPKLTVGTVYTSEKDQNDNWSSSFIKCKIVGEAKNQLAIDKCGEKDLIEIQSAVLKEEVRTYKDNQYRDFVLTIFKAEKVKPKEELTPVDNGDTPF